MSKQSVRDRCRIVIILWDKVRLSGLADQKTEKSPIKVGPFKNSLLTKLLQALSKTRTVTSQRVTLN
jgi:hypothetical protein